MTDPISDPMTDPMSDSITDPMNACITEAMNVPMNLRCFEVTTPFPGSRPLPRHCQSEACGDALHPSVHLMFCT